MFTFQKEFKNKGQIIAILPLLVVFTTMAMGLSYLYLNTSKQMEKQHICLEFGLKLQSIYARLAEKIEALNPKAKSLQIKEVSAKKAWQMAIDPKTKAAAYAYYKYIKYQQRLLRFQQKSLFQVYESKAKIAIFRFRSQHKYQSYKIAKKLHFRAKPAYSDSPIYIPKVNFSKKQSFVLKWNKKASIKNHVKGYCQVNLVKEEKKWFGKIKVGKVL